MELNKIYNEDCLTTIERMPEDFLDLTVTSPPYNVDLGNNKFNKNPYDLYNDNKNHKKYIEWLRSIFKGIYDKTKVGGRCVINIGDGQNGRVPTHSDIIQFMTHDLKWIPMFVIIWDKNSVSSRTSWGSFHSPSSPSFPSPFEYVLGFAKGSRKIQWKGETDLKKQEFIDWSLAKWTFSGESSKRVGHPAPFPLDLPLRCIKMLTWIGSTVYDPFSGSGTTAFACFENGRNYIGSEISEEYYNKSLERLSYGAQRIFQ